MDNLNSNGHWQISEPEPDEILSSMHHAVQALYFPPPKAYFEFLKSQGGGRGDLGIQPGFIEFWSASEVINRNARLELLKYAPGFLAFASDCGGELFTFQKDKFGIYLMPMIGMEPSVAILISPNFDEFITHIGKDTWDGK